MLQKAEKMSIQFTKRLEATTKDIILRFQSQLEAFHLNAFLHVLTKHLCEEKNERGISLALYIRLEFCKYFE